MREPLEGQSELPPATGALGPDTHGLVLRNTAWLVGAQVLATPLSVLVNAVMARRLGPAEFGYIYLAGTLCSFGFLLVDWGQGTALPALVARERSRAGELLGTALLWRGATSALVYLLLAAACIALGYQRELQLALGLIALAFTLGALANACQDAIRGFERTDLAAAGYVGQQLLTALLVVPTLLLGGGLGATLTAQAAAAGLGLLGVVLLFIRPLRRSGLAGLARISAGRRAAGQLLSQGSPFLLLGISLALQPNVDAVLLARLAPPEVVGWHAAARKLVGVLIVPAGALITSLYPTLSRLYAEDREAYQRTARAALRSATVLVVPLALGCALFPDLGTRIFDRDSFGPAEDNLRVLSLFILLVYFSMTLGSCLSAAGRQRPWALCQLACVAVSAVADPLLIPWFQARLHNGGLGVCVSTVISEVLMLLCSLWLAPRGLLDRAFARTLLVSILSGAAMVLVARLLSRQSPFLAAPLSILAWLGCLWSLGGLERSQLQGLRDALARRLGVSRQ